MDGLLSTTLYSRKFPDASNEYAPHHIETQLPISSAAGLAGEAAQVAEMNIVGHGIDLVDITKLQRWIDDPRDPLIPRCFVQEELDEVGIGPDRIQHLAGRFAAKEAVLKALSTGFGAGIAFSDVIIHRRAGGPPQVRLTGGAAKAAAKCGIVEWRLSISHTAAVAMASAIAIGSIPHGEGSSRN